KCQSHPQTIARRLEDVAGFLGKGDSCALALFPEVHGWSRVLRRLRLVGPAPCRPRPSSDRSCFIGGVPACRGSPSFILGRAAGLIRCRSVLPASKERRNVEPRVELEVRIGSILRRDAVRAMAAVALCSLSERHGQGSRWTRPRGREGEVECV